MLPGKKNYVTQHLGDFFYSFLLLLWGYIIRGWHDQFRVKHPQAAQDALRRTKHKFMTQDTGDAPPRVTDDPGASQEVGGNEST